MSPLTDADRWAVGIISVGLIVGGLGMILGRRGVANANAKAIRGFYGKFGEPFAASSRPWVFVMSGVVAVGIGLTVLFITVFVR